MEGLKRLRKDRGFTQAELGKLCGVSESIISQYEKGKKNPSHEVVIKLCEVLDCTFSALIGDAPRSRPVISERERKYAALDEYGKAAVDAVLDLEYRRCVDAEAEEAPKKVIPLFAAAAGPGEPVRDEFDEYEVDEKSPAQFAVKISGDSMEPELHDGDVVVCQRRKPKTGELAVIMVNGFLYVKQYIEAYEGNIYLRSLNRARKDCDVDILASGNDTVTGYGTVIFKPLRLVEE